MREQLELISLAELIDQIKTDLLIKGKGGNPAFIIDGVEVTAQVVARKDKADGGNAALSLSVLGLKADAGLDTKTTLASQLTQTVTIKLSPLLAKDEYLSQLSDEERIGIKEAAARVVARGIRGDAV